MKYVKFFGNNGYVGTEYEYYEVYDDNTKDAFIDQESIEYAYDNAETYEYLERGWDDQWYSQEDEDNYYENALDHCGWTYISKEEYKEHDYE